MHRPKAEGVPDPATGRKALISKNPGGRRQKTEETVSVESSDLRTTSARRIVFIQDSYMDACSIVRNQDNQGGLNGLENLPGSARWPPGERCNDGYSENRSASGGRTDRVGHGVFLGLP